LCAIKPKRAIDDPRNECVTVFLDAVRKLQPRIVVMENVPGLLSLAKGVALKTVMKTLSEAGYQTTHMVLQAAHYGSPQSRWRLFIVGSRSAGFCFPLPTHRATIKPNVAGGRDLTFRIPNTDDLFTQLLPAVTVGDAISDLPAIRNGGGKPAIGYTKPPRSDFQRAIREGSDCLTNHQTTSLGQKYMELVRALPEQGMCWLDLPTDLIPSNMRRSQEKWGRNSPTRFGRLKWDGFFTSILTRPEPYWGSFIHPTQDRVLSVREAARAQCFPDRIRFCGNLDDQYRQVGNAIPVLLARAVGEAVLEHLNNGARPIKPARSKSPSRRIAK
jgi:DNA (cytosine-5)-methyltransferase 1